MTTTPCGVKGCRRVARQAFDVGTAWHRRASTRGMRYRVCDAHAAEFFRGGGWIDAARSERIKDRVRGVEISLPGFKL